MIDFDFHIHSAPHSSCAKQSVKEAVVKAYSAGIKIMALCDHNCIDGLEEAKIECEKLGMTFVNGVELSVPVSGVSESVDGNVIHVLGYNIKPDKELFKNLKAQFDRDYQAQFDEKKKYLKSKGYCFSDLVTNNKQLREELCANGYFANNQEAKAFLHSEEIEKLFPPKKIPISEVVDIIHSLGGIAVLAHPNSAENHVCLTMEQTNQIIKFLVVKGLDGIEVFHPSTVSVGDIVDNLLEQARIYNLKVTLGSDRHNCDNDNGDEYFPMADKLKAIDYNFESIRTFWKT